MDWFVIRHPETGGVGVVGESSLDIWRSNGWIRVSDAISESTKDQVVKADYNAAPDLDAAPSGKSKTFIKES